MHAQWSKEWRLLRPGLVAAVGLAVVALVLPVDPQSRVDVSYLLTFCMFLGGVLLGIETFGREFHQQTSTLWLALPMSRAGLWRSKLAMVGLTVAGVALVHGITLLAGAPLRGFLPNFVELARPAFAIVGGAALGIFWSVLLRQNWAAFWMSLIVPGALMMLIQLLVVLFWPMPEPDQAARQPDVGGMFALGFCLVSVIAFVLARRRFDRLEDLGPVGEDVQLKAPRFLHAFLGVSARSERQTRNVNSALWWKEIRLQQVNLALAAGFAVVVVIAQLLRRMALAMSDRVSPRDLEAVDFLWALWSLLPLTIGLATVAEERRLGVDSWQATLPVSRARRWWIKIGAAYAIAFGIGVVVPVIGEMLTRADPFMNMLIFHGLAWLIMTTAGIYVSSLSRNLVHAISILVPFGVLLALALGGGVWLTEQVVPASLSWQAWLSTELHFMVMTGVMMFLALLWLAWRNSAPGWNHVAAWRNNLSVIAAVWVTGILLVSGMRARAWEWLRPEPAPGPALAAHPGVQPDVAIAWTHVTVLAPDGSLWVYGSPGVRTDSAKPASPRRLGEGHRWLSIGAGHSQLCAIRSDGTLWRWGQVLEPAPNGKGGWVRKGDLKSTWESPTQVIVDTELGEDDDWQAVAGNWSHTVALKQDGTLWGWGSNGDGQLGQTEAEYVAAPVQIGSATNWTRIAAGSSCTLAANRDGEVWEWGWIGPKPHGAEMDARRSGVPHRIASGVTWERLFVEAGAILGLNDRGEMWILRAWMGPFRDREFPARWPGSARRIVVLGWGDAWSIDGEGRLLRRATDQMHLDRDGGLPIAIEPRRVGNRSDWIALSGNSNFGPETRFGLTADGGLWTWGLPLGRQETLLPSSQRPRRVALLRAHNP
jgi:hypothetical protein